MYHLVWINKKPFFFRIPAAAATGVSPEKASVPSFGIAITGGSGLPDGTKNHNFGIFGNALE
jgi:hypothetical protein